MRIGPEKTIERERTLLDWGYESGYGIISGNNGYAPYESTAIPARAIAFCYEQYQRFGIPPPPQEVASVGAGATFYVLDYMDPYALLCGASDVEVSDGWAAYTYEVVDHEDGGCVVEAEAGDIETFDHIPGQDERMHLELLSKPGLEALDTILMADVGLAITDVISGDCGWERDDGRPNSAHNNLSPEGAEWLQRNCANEQQQRVYLDLAAWATYLWFAGPEARELRWNSHDVYLAVSAVTHEAVMYKGCLLDGKNVRRIDRTPQSCCVCGLDSWCVELVHVEGVTRTMCERCLNPRPVVAHANCGKQYCRYVECPHHPEHGRDGALMRVLHNRGQLTRLATPPRGRKLIGS